MMVEKYLKAFFSVIEALCFYKRKKICVYSKKKGRLKTKPNCFIRMCCMTACVIKGAHVVCSEPSQP